MITVSRLPASCFLAGYTSVREQGHDVGQNLMMGDGTGLDGWAASRRAGSQPIKALFSPLRAFADIHVQLTYSSLSFIIAFLFRRWSRGPFSYSSFRLGPLPRSHFLSSPSVSGPASCTGQKSYHGRRARICRNLACFGGGNQHRSEGRTTDHNRQAQLRPRTPPSRT